MKAYENINGVRAFQTTYNKVRCYFSYLLVVYYIRKKSKNIKSDKNSNVKELLIFSYKIIHNI